MRYAVIEDNVVVNIAIADYPVRDNWIPDDGTAVIGGTWDGNKFIPRLRDIEAEIKEETEAARAKRDWLLKESDWTQLPDVPDATKAAWATYRQALRDVPGQEGFPFEVIWPAKPE